MNHTLIIFTKNLVFGKVKTRLASSVGNDKAFEIYTLLIAHTHAITHQLSMNKIVFYSDEIEADDLWGNDYKKQLQAGNDLGERMLNAFEFSFQKSNGKAIIIGCDCPQLTTQIINHAFEQLDNCDVIIGPAEDGGYYLLGMKKLHEQLFANIEWSTNKVLTETIKRCNENKLSYNLLPTLNDVDEENDLRYMNILL